MSRILILRDSRERAQEKPKDSGREWCYLDPDLLPGLDPNTPRWGYCAPVVDYEAAC